MTVMTQRSAVQVPADLPAGPANLRDLVRGDFPEVDGVLVASGDDLHADSFSDQWNRWATTQVDSRGYRCGYAGMADSRAIFLAKTGLLPAELAGRVVLDAGCGTGRFSEIAASLGARVVAADLSAAVFHAAKLGREWKADSLFLKADLQALPLLDASIDICFSIGVLHHCESPLAAVREIRRILKPGGLFAGWVYAKQATYDHPLRARWRAFSTDPANRGRALALAEMAPVLRDAFAAGDAAALCALVEAAAHGLGTPWLAGMFDRLGPAGFREVVGISGSALDEECRLDSFDWMTPRYQWQHAPGEWADVLQIAGFQRIAGLPFPVSWRCR